MTSLDTNVLVRLPVRDDEDQFEHARKLIRPEAQSGDPVRISLFGRPRQLSSRTA